MTYDESARFLPAFGGVRGDPDYFRLSVDPPVSGGHLPIDEKINPSLCPLCLGGEYVSVFMKAPT